MEKNLEKECANWSIANKQRDHEVERGEGNLTEKDRYGFKDLGCYDCDGHDYKCPNYSPLTESPKLLMKRIEEDFHSRK